MPDIWYQLLSQLCARFYFSGIQLIPERPRLNGPTLLVALHRNGAVDGWVYKSIFLSATFLIAAQLRKNLLARVFFTGITVVRDKDDGDRTANTESLNRCQELLASGRVLAIFPEGTSSLGPRHLPFKSGAARIAHEAAQRQLPLTILPLGITYDAPSTFRSNVQVIVGAPFSPAGLSLPALELKLTSHLESLGINVDSDDHYRDIRALASFVSPELPYHSALKALEPAIPASLRDRWRALSAALAAHRLHDPEKSPFSPQPLILTLLATILLSPLAIAAAVLNFLPLLAAYFAGRKFADGPNVITLWRILVGAPLFFVWILVLLAVTIFLKIPLLFVAYIFISLLGLCAYAPGKRALRHSLNAVCFPSLRQTFLAFRCDLVQELRAHSQAQTHAHDHQ
jgi:1-acyl-sn-glycerol-3-phosphate acyltransferase